MVLPVLNVGLPIKLCHAMVLNMYYRVVCEVQTPPTRHTTELVATSKTASMIMTLGCKLMATKLLYSLR